MRPKPIFPYQDRAVSDSALRVTRTNPFDPTNEARLGRRRDNLSHSTPGSIRRLRHKYKLAALMTFLHGKVLRDLLRIAANRRL